MKTKPHKLHPTPAKSERDWQASWKSFVNQHWLLGHKVLAELKILVRLAGPNHRQVNGHSLRRMSSLRLKRA